eukprot:CAMPEP_0114564432 /NCGR_PEP_ID=MMETSP0114-20121206/13715_1 /TAXON_ID=31324 /ORGANISM="Goniomonas sp, Strain m" /LENGTH=64 /DNA_ID=CAMNT_0001750495 /DNA_START=25 /DNA_END=219 /DNA_ORIENTATION=-
MFALAVQVAELKTSSKAETTELFGSSGFQPGSGPYDVQPVVGPGHATWKNPVGGPYKQRSIIFA